MRQFQTDILVIGGGATGTGVLRDLAMRGFSCILVERRDLAYGTTGRYHGLLHSGGRYVVKDPIAARECIEENRILRRIMPTCIEDTGGFFVLTSYDDPAYVSQFIDGCHHAGIPEEEITIPQMLKEEPFLEPKIERCFRLPDGSADSFLAADLNAESARQHGAMVLPYHEVTQLNTFKSPAGMAVSGAICHDLVKDEDVQIDAIMVVNASGAWAAKITSLAGIHICMLPGKGTMVALNHRIVNTVINRCKMPSDGDILVPAHTVAVMGTTDVQVSDPDRYSIEPWEIRLMLDEGEKIIPGFKNLRILRAWAGVRPLLEESSKTTNRDISRSFTILDHSVRDGIAGFVTITGGKWTTYRKMAQVTVDKVCEKLNVSKPCTTHLDELPVSSGEKKQHFKAGAHLEKIEHQKAYGQLVCECELATREDIEKAIIHNNAMTFDDIRRDVRLGMGPCQGAFCGFRTAGLLHGLRRSPVIETNVALRNFLQERWKGIQPILWGHQLRQERFNELIYINNLNISNLPGATESRLSSGNYAMPSKGSDGGENIISQPANNGDTTGYSNKIDVVIVGAGLSGLVAGWRASQNGKKTEIITRGWGATYWTSGCIDILGYAPPDYLQPVASPSTFLSKILSSNCNHPYALVGFDTIEEAVSAFLSLSEEANYPYRGSLEKNIFLPTALGTLRPSCLVPRSMVAGDASLRSPMLIVGFSQYLDFFPSYIADNLNAQNIIAQGITLDLKPLRKLKLITASVLASLFDDPEFRQQVIDHLKPQLGRAGRIGFPAVLGLNRSMEVIDHLESALGLPIFEIPGLPPSIPGIRLHNLICAAIARSGGVVSNGMDVTSATTNDQRVTAMWSEAASRQVAHPARDYVLATGGYLGGGINVDELGYAKEAIFGFPVNAPRASTDQFDHHFLSQFGHPIFSTGLMVDPSFRLVIENGHPVLSNLFIAGSLIGSCDPIRERSLEGIALTSGYKIGESLGSAEGV